jgi:uncharacterized damage-inducible protein DinB
MPNDKSLNNALQHLFDTLEDQRSKLLGLITDLTHEQLHTHPEGKWSIAQVLSHLIASEHLSVKYLNKKMLGIHEAPNTGLIEEIKMIALIVSQRTPFIKFKAPRILAENTHVYQTAEQLKEAWDKNRVELKEVIAHFQDNQLKRKIYKHPIAGMLNIKQALQFFREHIDHHTPQVKNLLR